MIRRFPLILALASLCFQSLAAGSLAADAKTADFLMLLSHDPSTSSRTDPGNIESKPADLKLRGRHSPKALSDPKASDWSVYSFLEETAQHNADQAAIDRFGLGGYGRFGRWARLSGEISTTEDGSLSALTGGSCDITDRIRFYSNSGFDTRRADEAFTGMDGTLTSGVRLRLSEKAGVFGEEHMQFAEGLSVLTHSVGFDLRSAPGWSWGMALEMVDLNDPNAAKRRRRGGRLSTGYSRKGLRFGSSLEMHMENGCDPAPTAGWNARNDFEVQMAQGWSLLGRLNVLFETLDIDRPFEGVNIECLTELTHKPSDRGGFRMLVKYAFSPDDGDGRTDLQGGLYTSINDTLRVGLAYNFDHFSHARTEPSSNPGWFLEIAGTF